LDLPEICRADRLLTTEELISFQNWSGTHSGCQLVDPKCPTLRLLQDFA